MYAQELKNRNKRGTGWAGQRLTSAREGIGVSGRCKTRRFGRVRDALQTVCKHGLPRGTANNAEYRGRGRCGPGVVSTGVCPSQELQRRFPVFDVGVPHCHQRRLMKLRKKHVCGMCRWMNRPKPKSRLPGLKSKTKARVPNSSTPNRNSNEFFPRQ